MTRYQIKHVIIQFCVHCSFIRESKRLLQTRKKIISLCNSSYHIWYFSPSQSNSYGDKKPSACVKRLYHFKQCSPTSKTKTEATAKIYVSKLQSWEETTLIKKQNIFPYSLFSKYLRRRGNIKSTNNMLCFLPQSNHILKI